jgi:hypothetical protein
VSEPNLVDEEEPAGPLGKREWAAIIGGAVAVLALVLVVLTVRGGNDAGSSGGSAARQPVAETSPEDNPCVTAMMDYMRQSLQLLQKDPGADQSSVELAVGMKYRTSDAMYGIYYRLDQQLTADVLKNGANGALARILPAVRQECE